MLCDSHRSEATASGQWCPKQPMHVRPDVSCQDFEALILAQRDIAAGPDCVSWPAWAVAPMCAAEALRNYALPSSDAWLGLSPPRRPFIQVTGRACGSPRALRPMTLTSPTAKALARSAIVLFAATPSRLGGFKQRGSAATWRASLWDHTGGGGSLPEALTATGLSAPEQIVAPVKYSEVALETAPPGGAPCHQRCLPRSGGAAS